MDYFISTILSSQFLLASSGAEGESPKVDPYWVPFWTLGILAVLFFILQKFAWPGILAVIEERETKIKESLEAAEKATADMDKAIEEQKLMIAKAREEAQGIVAEARNAAEASKESILESAQTETTAMTERAHNEIKLAEQKALESVRSAAVDLSLQAASKILGRVLDTDDHRSLAQQCVKEVEQLRN